MKVSLTLFISTEINVYTHTVTGSRTTRTGNLKSKISLFSLSRTKVFVRIVYLDFITTHILKFFLTSKVPEIRHSQTGIPHRT
jgi:hypothetical protein